MQNAINATSTGIQSLTSAGVFNGRTITGTTNQISITNGDGTAGNPTIAFASTMLNSSQPSFLAFKSSTSAGVTGNGTLVTIICDSLVYDQCSSYNTSTGTFTAPIAGNYVLAGGISTSGITILNTSWLVNIHTSTRNVRVNQLNPGALFDVGGLYTTKFFTIRKLALNEAVTIQLTVSNGATANVNLIGNATDYVTWFGGYLLL